MNSHCRASRSAFLIGISLFAVVSLLAAQQSRAHRGIDKDDLEGSWQATLIGNTGCGLSTSLVTFTLNSKGVATDAANIGHFLVSSPCYPVDDSLGFARVIQMTPTPREAIH